MLGFRNMQKKLEKNDEKREGLPLKNAPFVTGIKSILPQSIYFYIF